jgi:hypothetical protein
MVPDPDPDPDPESATASHAPSDDETPAPTTPTTGGRPSRRDASGSSTPAGRGPGRLRTDGGSHADDRPSDGTADRDDVFVDGSGPDGDVDTDATGAAGTSGSESGIAGDGPVVRITKGLLAYLLDRAAGAEPESTSLVLGSTAADGFETDLGLAPETPILTHVYLPDAGRPVSAVFGVDLGTPAGRGRARFLSHPQGPLGVTRRDDLAAVVIVAVPPWDEGSFAAFDRSGRRLELRQLDAAPPDEPFGSAGDGEWDAESE